MPNSFSHTLRSVEGERAAGRSVAVLLPAIVIFAAWAAWMTMGDVGVSAVSARARLEAREALFAIHTPVAAEVIEQYLNVGRTVEKGEVLIVLDHAAESLAIEVAAAGRASVEREIEALEREIDAAERAMTALRRRRQPLEQETRFLHEAARSRAQLAIAEARRVDALEATGNASRADAERATYAAAERASEVQGLSASLDRVRTDIKLEIEDRRRDIARLHREIARLTGEIEVHEANLQRLTHQMTQYTIRAHRAGVIAEITELSVGSRLQAGQKLATVMGDGKIGIQAQFSPTEAVGRVRSGQTARMFLDGFNWSQYGVVEAVVERVATEYRDGLIRVELSVERAPSGLVGLEHGLSGKVEIEVERLSPATLLLRMAGGLVHPRDGGDHRSPAPNIVGPDGRRHGAAVW